MAEDLLGSLLAVCLLPLFLWIPGYALGWMFDLFEFRRRTTAFRVTLSLPLSIAVCPIATYLLARFGSMVAVWPAYAAAAVVFCIAQRRLPRRRGLPGGSVVMGGIALAWLALALFSLVDLQWGNRLYYPTNSFDYSLRAALTHAISATGVPPQSPLFLPDRPVTLRYHYFWLMMCSLANQVAPRWISARQAEIAGTFWCGLGLMALIAGCLRLFVVNEVVPLRRRALAGLCFLGITGLDILPGLFYLLMYAGGKMDIFLPSLETWNEYVDWFLHSVLWAPHAVAALIAALTGFLLLWHAPEAASRRGTTIYGVLAGAAFASTAGISIWVAFVFGVFLMLWTTVCFVRRWRRETMAMLAAGLTSIVLAWPYLHELRSAGGSSSGHLLEFTVRDFAPAVLIPSWPGMGHWTRLILVNGPLLPLNYFLEFGCFFLIGRVKWRRYRASGQPLARQDLACALLLATSALICTFLKSAVIGNNDLGWRGFLPAQFVLLLWSVDVWIDRDTPGFLPAGWKQPLIVFIVLGAAGSAYDLALTRFYPILADRGVLPPIRWMAPDRRFGERNYAAREAYEWARAATAENAVIQFDPAVGLLLQETPAMLYADRRAVAAETNCNLAFGGDREGCRPVVRRLEQLYPAAGGAALSGVGDICRSLPVDLFVAKATDPVWTDRRSWVWTETPVFANRYARVFGCRDADRLRMNAHLHE
jgi:hypothetical protein